MQKQYSYHGCIIRAPEVKMQQLDMKLDAKKCPSKANWYMTNNQMAMTVSGGLDVIKL